MDARRVASGKMFAGAYPLYGYLWGDPAKGERTHYVEDRETAWVVRRIFQAVADGVPIWRLCRQLEAEGIPTPGQVLAMRGQLSKGRSFSTIWRRATIQRICHHPAYWGAYVAYRRHHSTEKIRPAVTGITTKVRRTRERAEDDAMRVTLPESAAPALVSRELAARAHARLQQNKAEQTGGNPDPLATLWRTMVRCGQCGAKMHTATAGDGYGRRYYCRSRTNGPDGVAIACPGGVVSMAARVLDPAGWADVLAWLREEENVAGLFADWQQERAASKESISSRLDAVGATIVSVRAKMDALAETIAETTKGESRRTL